MSAPEKAPEKAEPAKVPEAPAIAEAAEKNPEPPKAPAKPAKKAEAAGEELEPPANRKALDAMVAEHGKDAAVKALSKVRVVDLRAMAREYNGEFGIAGREIRNANKKVLIEEFSKFFDK